MIDKINRAQKIINVIYKRGEMRGISYEITDIMDLRIQECIYLTLLEIRECIR